MARLNFFRAENIFALQQKPGQAAIFSALTTPILAPTVSKGTRSEVSLGLHSAFAAISSRQYRAPLFHPFAMIPHGQTVLSNFPFLCFLHHNYVGQIIKLL
jgi:hypothetical protein